LKPPELGARYLEGRDIRIKRIIDIDVMIDDGTERRSPDTDGEKRVVLGQRQTKLRQDRPRYDDMSIGKGTHTDLLTIPKIGQRFDRAIVQHQEFPYRLTCSVVEELHRHRIAAGLI